MSDQFDFAYPEEDQRRREQNKSDAIDRLETENVRLRGELATAVHLLRTAAPSVGSSTSTWDVQREILLKAHPKIEEV